MVEFKDLGITTATLLQNMSFNYLVRCRTREEGSDQTIVFLQLEFPSQKFSVALTEAAERG